MQELSVINSIKRGVISPVYLFYGTEEYLQEKVINALKEALVASDIGSFNLDELEGEEVTIDTIVDIANTLPVFAEKRLVIVKNAPFLSPGNKKKEEDEEAEDKEAPKKPTAYTSISEKQEKRLLQYLGDPLISTCLVFWQKGSVNKNRKIYKTIVASKGQILAMNALKSRELNSWLISETKKMGKVLEPQAAEYISFNCGNQLRDLHNELEKLALYTITLAMTQKVITKSSEGNIFSLVDNLGQKKGEEALKELENLLAIGEPPVRIVYMIARQFRLLLLAKDLQTRGYYEKEIASELDLHPYVTSKILRQIHNFSFIELERDLELIWKSDFRMKSGLNQELTLESLVIALGCLE
jgi:DNA polymerase-3 subunit delta